MQTRRGWVGLWVVALLGMILNAASAQQPGRRPGGPGGPGGFGGGPGGGAGGGQLSLLSNEKIQAELDLIDDQKKDLEEARNGIREQMGKIFEGARDMSREEREALMKEKQPEMEKLTKELQEKIKGILLPHQQERLMEVFVQIRGPGALNDADVAAALKLSDEQKTDLAKIREEMGTKMGELFQGFGRGRPEGEGQAQRPEGDPREKMEALRNETTEKYLAVLTSEQRDQFEKMKGEKFDFDPNEFRLGGGGPGGPGGFQRRPGGGDGERRRPEGDRPSNDT